MKLLYFFLFFILILFQSCDRLSKGIIVNDSSDTISIKLVANDVKDMKVNWGNKLFPSQYFEIFKDSIMINPKTDWKEPIFRGEFKLAPNTAFDFGVTMGRFGIPSIYFDTLIIINKRDTLIFKNKRAIYDAFKTSDDVWYYLRIGNKGNK
jgi:hypothetical protein